MSPLALTVWVGFLAQAVLSLVIAFLLSRFYGLYHRGYLRHWAWSWLAACMYLTCAASALALSRLFPAEHPLWLLVAVGASVAAYLQITWLLFGTYELLGSREVAPRLRRTLPAVATVTGVVLALLFVWTPDAAALRYFTRVGVRGLLAGIAFLVAGFHVFRTRLAPPGFGPRMVGGAFLFYGLQQLYYFALTLATLVSAEFHRSFEYGSYLGFLDLVLQWVMGVGMVLCLLEEERAAALAAAEQVKYLAYHDALTGLPNRQLLLDRLVLALAHAHREQRRVAILFVDLDRFKQINDSLGHSAGDRLLQEVARRIHAAVREGDTLARLGGDEFILLIPGLHASSDALKVAHKVLAAVRASFMIEGRELYITTSAGLSVYPEDGEDAETLVKNADAAMTGPRSTGATRSACMRRP